jgi:hypothetical protein
MSKPASNFQQLARSMFRRAIADSAPQLGLKGSAQVVETLRRGYCQSCETLRFNLARQVADYIALVDPDMRALYLYDPEYASGDYECAKTASSPSSGIHLIAWTRAKKSIPSDKLQELRAAFQDARADILCPDASGLCYSLNVAVVNDADVRTRKGYASMIDSTTVRPTQVWARYRVAG